MSLSPNPASGGPSTSKSPSPDPSSAGPSSSSAGHNKYNLSPAEVQRLKLERLLKDPSKPVHVPGPAREKTLRAPREMMKNVQGSSAGAGSGEFHVYKQNRRREYERLKLMDEKAKKEEDQQLFEQRQKANQESADAKTDKNRLRRLKKKARQTGKPLPADFAGGGGGEGGSKKRKLAGGGAQVVFKRPGEESESDEDEGPVVPAQEDEREQEAADEEQAGEDQPKVYVEEQPMIVIHDD